MAAVTSNAERITAHNTRLAALKEVAAGLSEAGIVEGFLTLTGQTEIGPDDYIFMYTADNADFSVKHFIFIEYYVALQERWSSMILFFRRTLNDEFTSCPISGTHVGAGLSTVTGRDSLELNYDSTLMNAGVRFYTL